MVKGATITNRTISIIFADGKPENISASHPNFDKVREKLLARDYTDIRRLFKVQNQIERFEEDNNTETHLVIKNGIAFYKQRPLNNAMGKKLVEEIERNQPIDNFIRFIGKVMQNPSKTAVDELMLFIESGYMGLTDSGNFLAYKRVRGDFKDIHSGTMDNSPGQTVEMMRNEVCDDRRQTCSYGLHFCSYDYLSQFGSCAPEISDRVVIVEVDPADVVSIPADYSNTKGRACKYKVLQEVEGWAEENVMAKTDFSLDNSFEEDYDDEEAEDDYDADSYHPDIEEEEEEDEDDWFTY